MINERQIVLTGSSEVVEHIDVCECCGNEEYTYDYIGISNRQGPGPSTHMLDRHSLLPSKLRVRVDGKATVKLQASANREFCGISQDVEVVDGSEVEVEQRYVRAFITAGDDVLVWLEEAQDGR